jgi:putative ABC transport system permease protein
MQEEEMLLNLAIKNLWRRKMRSFLTILGVATAVQLYLMVHGIMASYGQEMRGQIGEFAGKIIVQQQLENGRGNADLTSSGSSLTSEMAEDLLSTRGVDRASSSAMIFVPIARAIMPYVPPAVIAVGIEPGHEKAFLGGLEIEQDGTMILRDPNDVILGQNAAKYFHESGENTPAAVGTEIQVGGRILNVVGILKTAPELFSNSVVMPLATAQEIFDRKGTVSSVILSAARLEDVPAMKEDILARFDNLTVSTQEDMLQNADAVLNGMNLFMGMIENSIIVVAIIIITIVVIVTVMEQRREIGTLRAVGAGRLSICSMVAGESMILSLLGTILALPIALFSVQWGMKAYFSSVPGIEQVWWQTAVVTVLIGLFASLLPAWQAVRVDPMESLRYE